MWKDIKYTKYFSDFQHCSWITFNTNAKIYANVSKLICYSADLFFFYYSELSTLVVWYVVNTISFFIFFENMSRSCISASSNSEFSKIIFKHQWFFFLDSAAERREECIAFTMTFSLLHLWTNVRLVESQWSSRMKTQKIGNRPQMILYLKHFSNNGPKTKKSKFLKTLWMTWNFHTSIRTV